MACEGEHIPVILCRLRPLVEMLTKPSPPSKPTIISQVCDDEDVKFYWLIASADFEIDDEAP